MKEANTTSISITAESNADKPNEHLVDEHDVCDEVYENEHALGQHSSVERYLGAHHDGVEYRRGVHRDRVELPLGPRWPPRRSRAPAESNVTGPIDMRCREVLRGRGGNLLTVIPATWVADVDDGIERRNGVQR